jgi:4-carboxymuconolactone decarboxylase
MDRTELSNGVYRRLFGTPDGSVLEQDPELMTILRRLIFGDIFRTGDLSDRTRELITVVVLATQQTLPQLKAHTAAALNVGVAPLEVREAVYQCAPFIGFPRTLNAMSAVNEVLHERGIELPLPRQDTVSEDDRFEKGRAIQFPLYGDEIRENLTDLPDGLGDVLARLLTESCFGDFYTRGGLTVADRELLVLCVLAALGGTEIQLRPHAAGNLKVGNGKATQVAAMIHCYPYVGFPRAVNAIRIIKDLPE